MSHKIDRIGSARHLFATQTTNTSPINVTDGGDNNVADCFVRIINAVAQSENGQSVCTPSGSSNLAASTRIMLGQQIAPVLPDANALALEVWGNIHANFPAGVTVRPAIGLMTALGSSNFERETLSHFLYIGPSEIWTGAATQDYHANVVVTSDAPFVGIAHGFILTETAAAVRSCAVTHMQLGFRTLDTPANFKYYDPVR